ncbi:DUF5309 domain-containing protein [Pseudoduganella chitinolytica]|uniref:DUF5309 domain-containing protein n=1 Tax=Pseudoduganella chitinolytica TaxID=34070 RepID=A0ABY8BIW6_9BURK|nr:DUF5309 domain-containing protein [Pseudoduganella chitinolytica]WEF34866.1 DUF5309 domain-containing protein [Pseudoduganella chitinolytica]
MAAPTNTQSSTSAVGNREDLTDIIDRITPSETPFYSMIKKTKATGTLHEWQTQALRAAQLNAHAEGDDTTATAVTQQVRLGNRTQILKEAASVSGTQENVDKAGQKSEMNKQLALKGAELKLDIEYSLTRNSTAATAPRTMRGLTGWMDAANVNAGAGYVAPNYQSNVAQTDGTQRAFTETLLKDTLQKTYISGGRPTVLMLGAVPKQTFSTFTGNATRQKDADDSKLNATIEIYRSDFGTLSAVINLQQRARDVFVLQPDKWAFAVLRPWEKSPLAKTGDSERMQILLEGTLEAINPKANGAVLDIS